MDRQKSFENEGPILYLVPTPIGNLQEMTPRALDVLRQADAIAAEDTRNTQKLLNAYDIHKPLFSHYEHNQDTSIPKIISKLKDGQTIAVVSDAGYPLISDPGQGLVRAVLDAGYPVVSVSGANAALNALVASGLSARHYLFYGFLDHKSSKRRKELETLAAFPYTMIFYEAPHRIHDTLVDLLEVLGDRQICLARELTKVHEEYLRGSVSEIIAASEGLKGEMVIVADGSHEKQAPDVEQMVEEVRRLQETMRMKAAVKQVAERYGYSKNVLYQEVLKRK